MQTGVIHIMFDMGVRNGYFYKTICSYYLLTISNSMGLLCLAT